MQDWIAGSMAVLGTLLVLAGGAVIVVRAMRLDGAPEEQATGETTPVKPTSRLVHTVRNMPAADRLIGWGIVLLVLGAVAAGAISFNLGANAGTQ